MATILDRAAMLLPKNQYIFFSNRHICHSLTLHRSNLAIELLVRMTFAWLNSTIIFTVDKVLRRFCA